MEKTARGIKRNFPTFCNDFISDDSKSEEKMTNLEKRIKRLEDVIYALSGEIIAKSGTNGNNTNTSDLQKIIADALKNISKTSYSSQTTPVFVPPSNQNSTIVTTTSPRLSSGQILAELAAAIIKSNGRS